jgi:tRNA pseudouridine38-40 synthase
MDKQRWAMGVAYEGTQYVGWQIQNDSKNTVQAHVEKALSFVANEPIHVTCAGRTDAKVHASGQVIHCDTIAQRDAHSFILGANSVLPRDISITWAQVVPESFNARFSANSRRYRYLIYNHRSRPGILDAFVTWQCRPLDEQRMQEAANSLLGEHDFSAFRGASCQAHSPVRSVHHCSIKRFQDIIILDIKANAFLMHMVRNIVGSLSLVGMNRYPVDWFLEVLQQKDRKKAGPTAPPNGLCLVDVYYPEFELPKSTPGPLSWAAFDTWEK